MGQGVIRYVSRRWSYGQLAPLPISSVMVRGVSLVSFIIMIPFTTLGFLLSSCHCLNISLHCVHSIGSGISPASRDIVLEMLLSCYLSLGGISIGGWA